MGRIVIGVDIGTTSTKAVAFTPAGRVLAHDTIEYPLLQPEAAAAEQDPQQIFQAVLSAIASCVKQSKAAPADVLAVSFSAAMHSLILVDDAGAPGRCCPCRRRPAARPAPRRAARCAAARAVGETARARG